MLNCMCLAAAAAAVLLLHLVPACLANSFAPLRQPPPQPRLLHVSNLLYRARAATVLVEWQRQVGVMDVEQFKDFSAALLNMRHDMFEYFNALIGVENFNAVCHFSLLPNLIYEDNFTVVQELTNIWFDFMVQSLMGNNTEHFMFRYLQQYLRIGRSEVTYSSLLRHTGQPRDSTLFDFARRRLPDVPIPQDCRRTLLVQLTDPQKLLDSQQCRITAVLQSRLINTLAPGIAYQQFNSTHRIINFVDLIIFGHFEALRTPNRLWIEPSISGTLPGQLSSVAGLIRYGYPALLAVGTLSNIVALLFSALVLSESNACLYFLALSLLDLLCLWCNLLPTILSLYGDIFLHKKSSLTCRLIPFLQEYFSAAVAWTVAALTVAKVLTVLKPFNRTLHSRRAHRVCIAVVLATVAMLCSPLLVNRHRIAIVEIDFLTQCWRWDWFLFTYRFEQIWFAVVFPALPLAVILLCNCTLLALRDRHLRLIATASGGAASSATDRRQSFGSLTFVSSVFLVFTAPNTVVHLIEASHSGDIKQYDVINELSNGTGTLFNYWAHVTHFVMLLHNAFNIFTYGMNAPHLRQTFRMRMARFFRCDGFLQTKPLYGSMMSMRTTSSQRTDRTDTECTATAAAAAAATAIGPSEAEPRAP